MVVIDDDDDDDGDVKMSCLGVSLDNGYDDGTGQVAKSPHALSLYLIWPRLQGG